MNMEHHRWYSPRLGHDMDVKVYGHYGKPVVAFPAQSGRFYDFEGFGMVRAVEGLIDQGKIKLFAVDGIDWQSWCNWSLHPRERGWRHEDYDAYIVQEVCPFVRAHCGGTDQRFLATGCSMGGYHAANFFFRHPDLFDSVISLSAVFQLQDFIGDYMDDRVYFNSPVHYLPGLEDPWFLDRYRRSFIVVCTGQGAWEEAMLADARRLQEILAVKGIPAWFDFWGRDVNHDWPWWRRQLPFFLGHVPGIR